MKTGLRLFAFFLIFFSSIQVAWPQPSKNFSKDPQKFLDELTAMFETAQTKEQKDAGKALMADFSALWLGNEISPAYKDSIFSTCNIMLGRKMKTFPNFELYLTTAVKFVRSSQDESSFNAWSFSLRKMASMSNSLRFMALLESTNGLLTDNTLYQTRIMYWRSSSDNFYFAYDSLPCVVIGKSDLTCVKKNDSTKIFATEGKYYPTTNDWKGKGGRILWERAGYPENEVHAEIFNYQIDIQKSEFNIDTVRFYNTNFFDRPLYGSLEEKVLVDVGDERVSYPRFNSFDKRLQIKGIFKNVDYEGGFSMHGPKLMGMGDAKTDAMVIFNRNNEPFIRFASKNFIIRKNTIVSERSAVSIYWEGDSIFHPGLSMRYNNDSTILSIMRPQTGVGQTPFFDSYHMVDIYVEAMYWKVDEPKIDLQMLKGSGSESYAVFESDSYFSFFRYEKLKGLEEVHPLYIFRDIAVANGSKTFSVGEVQRKMHIGKDQALVLLLNYATKGFLLLDFDDETVTLKDRVYHYLNSRNKKTDYDVIFFKSTISAQPNATLNLLNFDLKLRGVPMVYLSDSQNVSVIPYEQELVLKKNRDFTFDGQIHAGLFDYFGKNFVFKYDKFKLEMPTIDSMSFKVQDYTQPANAFGLHPFKKVRTVIEDLVGDIIIDDPGNKSGLVQFKQYPSFTSKKESYVYYDKKFIYNGVYSRDRFYFRLQPFKIDSLDSYFSELKEFKGYLVSAGIFPDITEPLKVQPDFSLGFVITTPPTGFPAYGGKGTYDSIVDLSYKGFRGKGNLKYLTSVMKSQDIIFFPDSMHATAEHYEIKEKSTPTEYPHVLAKNAYVHWYPYLDVMDISLTNSPFEMYDNNTTLFGNLSLEPKGLGGDGLLSFSKVEMRSEKYNFKHHTFQSDTTDVVFKTPDLTEMVLRTQNFNVNIDFQKQLGKFTSNDVDSKISFPFNNYACYMYNFDWLMDKDELALKSALREKFKYAEMMKKEEVIDVDLTESRFISEHPGQDSLQFYAPLATYNLNENVIRTADVPVILVADAAIFPDSGKVTILKRAEMMPLNNAQLIANVENKKHLLYECILNIETKKKYSGQGTYDYVDITNTKQKVFFSHIYVDSLKTRASGDIVEATGFTLSPDFGFKGKVNLTAEKDLLNFDGGTRIKHDCDTMPRRWLRFATEIDPLDIRIPVSSSPKEINAEGGNGSDLGMGLFAGGDSVLVYAAFADYKHQGGDDPVLTSNGYLTFDHTNQTYTLMPQIDSSASFIPAYDVVNFDRRLCKVYGSGKINMVDNLGRMKIATYGSMEHTIPDMKTHTSLVMTMDFPFDEDAMNVLSKALENAGGTAGVDIGDDDYYTALKYQAGPEKADQVLSQLNLSGRIKDMPDELQHSFYFSEVSMNWNFETRSFVSEGTIGFVSTGKTQLFKQLDGYIEVQRKRGGTIINLYFEVGDDWYFFSYQSNRMQALSSNNEFVDAIKKAMSDNKNQIKAEDTEPAYSYILSTVQRKKTFLKKIGASAEPGGDD